jgi:hypothetical protein
MSEIRRLERDPLRRCERRSPAAAPVSFVHCPGAGGVEYLQKDPIAIQFRDYLVKFHIVFLHKTP